MPNRPNFPIPSVINPPKTRCIQLYIPDNEDWVEVFVGLLAQPTYWFNWERTGDIQGSQTAKVWNELFVNIDWGTMSCCEDPLIRLNPDGSISVSTDGGITYHTDNSQDPRYQLPIFPPQVGDNPADTKCKAANSIVRQMKDIQIGNSAKIGVDTTILAMATSLIGLAVLVFVDPALIPFLIGAVFELASALLVTTSTAYNALFSDDDWNWVLCEIYCKLSDDGTFPADQFVNLQSDFDSHFTGNAALTFSSILNTWQLPGINRAGSIPTSDNLDCSSCPDCECPDICMTEWTFYGVTDVVFDGCNTYTMNAIGTPNHVAFSSGDSAIGCYYDAPLGSYNYWPVGSGSPVGGTNPKVTQIWNADEGSDYSAAQPLTFIFSSAPIT
jgi:hypothetical protein